VNDSRRLALERECRTFTRYLVRLDPSPYVVAKYCEAHSASSRFSGSRFDERLTALARWHPLTAFLADAYATVFAPRGLLRKKLILVLAVLEVSPPFFRELDRPLAGGPVRQLFAMALRTLVFGAVLLGAVVALLPLRLMTPRRDRTAR